MFMLTLPADRKPEGQCRINAQPATYRLHADRIEFRHKDTDPWQSRKILERRPLGGPEGLTTFICDDGPNSSGPYHVFEPTMTKDGQPAVQRRQLGEAHDLTTHEGRLSRIREARDNVDPGHFFDCLAQARQMEPFPVIIVTPDLLRFTKRSDVLRRIGSRHNDPRLWDDLSSNNHHPDTVFWMAGHGDRLSYVKSLAVRLNA